MVVTFDVTRQVALKNEAFWGHDETGAFLNQGKTLDDIKFHAKYHALLPFWLEAHPVKVSWFTARLKDKMIDIIANKALEKIIGQVNKERFNSLECGEPQVTNICTCRM